MTKETDFQMEDIRAMIRDAGLRCTKSRSTVLSFMVDAEAPLSHADLSDELVPEGYDQATLYRNLTDLTEAGLLTRLDLGDHIWRFEFRSHGDSTRNEHPHFVCNDCGEVACLSPVDITFRSAEKDGELRASVGQIDEVFLKGRCADCS